MYAGGVCARALKDWATARESLRRDRPGGLAGLKLAASPVLFALSQ